MEYVTVEMFEKMTEKILLSQQNMQLRMEGLQTNMQTMVSGQQELEALMKKILLSFELIQKNMEKVTVPQSKSRSNG